MQLIIWLVLAWMGGFSAILGSLLTIASLLLWLVPASSVKQRKTDSPEPQVWMKRLGLTVVAVAIALVGWGVLVLVPFPGR